MYILLEMNTSDLSREHELRAYDCMGYTISEASAMHWVESNSDYRKYIYCPEREL